MKFSDLDVWRDGAAELVGAPVVLDQAGRSGDR
jgi:hypothetical protein